MKNFITKKIVVSLVLIMTMCFNSIGVLAVGDELKGGAILHAWCWSFNAIKDNMKSIAAAGYKAVQISPPQQCVINRNCKENCEECITGGCKHFKENWYFHYQPTNFTIGNFQLGPKKAFEEMCKEAEKFGVKIIVDIVANHVASDRSLVAKKIREIEGGAFHNKCVLRTDNAQEWENDRFKITHGDFSGLADLNTHNKNVQKMIMNYMNDCLECGAWGFRYDAAQHIELPEEIDGEFGSDFWPTILDNAKKNGAGFQYAETYLGSAKRLEEYAKFMNVTSPNYGKYVRDVVCSRKFTNWNFMNYEANGVDPDKLVTWVECHDNFADGNPKAWGLSHNMSDEEIRIAWAMVASRKAGVPLFFSRPVDSGGPGVPQFFEGDRIGKKGSDLFKERSVVAVNKFREAMKDENENIVIENDNLLMIERGNKGMVIINRTGNSSIDLATKLSDGIYVDRVSGTTRFEVKNGRIFGNTKDSVTVLTREGAGEVSESVDRMRREQAEKDRKERERKEQEENERIEKQKEKLRKIIADAKEKIERDKQNINTGEYDDNNHFVQLNALKSDMESIEGKLTTENFKGNNKLAEYESQVNRIANECGLFTSKAN